MKVGKGLQDHLLQPSPCYHCHPLKHVPTHNAALQPFGSGVILGQVCAELSSLVGTPRALVPEPGHSGVLLHPSLGSSIFSSYNALEKVAGNDKQSWKKFSCKLSSAGVSMTTGCCPSLVLALLKSKGLCLEMRARCCISAPRHE